MANEMLNLHLNQLILIDILLRTIDLLYFIKYFAAYEIWKNGLLNEVFFLDCKYISFHVFFLCICTRFMHLESILNQMLPCGVRNLGKAQWMSIPTARVKEVLATPFCVS